MKTHSFKRWIAGLLSAALCLSAFLGLGITKAFAKGEQAEVCLVSFPREGDANYSTTTWGHDDIKLMNGWFFQKGKYLTVYSMGSYNGKICYCIEPSTMVKSGDRLSSTNETYWDNYPDKYNKTISGKNVKLIIGRILQYGYTGTISTSWRSQNSEDAAKLSNATATQLLILNRITANRAKGKNTFIFIDEIYLLFQHEYSANFLFTLWKRVRKYGAYATGITQNVDDLLQSHTARTMLANSEFIIMLNQAPTDRIELAKLLNISDNQLSYITNVGAGHGLIKVGSSLIPFANKFPKSTKLYKLMTTKPGEGV